MGRSTVGLIIFLAGFTVLLLIVSHFYLLPALEVRKGASEVEKHGLTAWSRLLLAILLVVLISGLIMSVRLGRLFFPRSKASQTKYVDAWKESGRRASLPPESSDPE